MSNLDDLYLANIQRYVPLHIQRWERYERRLLWCVTRAAVLLGVFQLGRLWG